jgi:hypothetical protein
MCDKNDYNVIKFLYKNIDNLMKVFILKHLDIIFYVFTTNLLL